MTRKPVRRGPRAGLEMWSCSRSPDCRGAINIDPEPAERTADPSPAAIRSGVPGAYAQARFERERERAWLKRRAALPLIVGTAVIVMVAVFLCVGEGHRGRAQDRPLPRAAPRRWGRRALQPSDPGHAWVYREALAVQVALGEELTAERVTVTPIICAIGGVARSGGTAGGVHVTDGKRLARLLAARPTVFDDETVQRLARLADRRLRLPHPWQGE